VAARLEKAVAISGLAAPGPGANTEAGPTLDGIFLPAEGDGAEGAAAEDPGREPAAGALVAPPHPLFGGRMDNPVVSEIAYACSAAGIASLRFDWRGAGGSAGAPSGEARDADADYAAALAHLAETVPGPLVACGYSFGAAAALRAAAHPRVARLVLVALPPALADREALARLERPTLLLAGSRDELAPWRELQALLGEAQQDARLEVVPEADHFFTAGLGDLRRHLLDWL